jgi:hypothetical protein
MLLGIVGSVFSSCYYCTQAEQRELCLIGLLSGFISYILIQFLDFNSR